MSSYVVVLTYVHTIISLVALALGIPVVARLLNGRTAARWTDWFLVAAIATTATGFLFPFNGVTPAFATGLVASALFALVLIARYRRRYAGHWRWIYATGMVASVYLLAFVGVVQAFLKLPPVNALAPTQTEPAFLIAQTGTLIAFVILALLAALRFRGEAERVIAEAAGAEPAR